MYNCIGLQKYTHCVLLKIKFCLQSHSFSICFSLEKIWESMFLWVSGILLLVLFLSINKSFEIFVLALDTTRNKVSQIHQSVSNFIFNYKVFGWTFCEKILKVSGVFCRGCHITGRSFSHLAIQRIWQAFAEKNTYDISFAY